MNFLVDSIFHSMKANIIKDNTASEEMRKPTYGTNNQFSKDTIKVKILFYSNAIRGFPCA